MEIRGSTRIVGLLGWPVHHTFSPAMHNAAFRELGLDYVYLPFGVRPEHLGRAVAGLEALDIVGVNVTVPHKEAVIPHLDELSEEARCIGSVNTIRVRNGRLTGYNTDAYGFEQDLREGLGLELKGLRVFVMGAGGVSRAVCFRAALSGAREVVIADILAERSRALGEAVRRAAPQCRVATSPAGDPGAVREALRDKDLFVNATPVGMGEQDPPLIETEWLPSGAAVFDVIYNPPKTRLLREASGAGHAVRNGLGMLIHQGARAFEIFTGEKAPFEVMRKALERILGPEDPEGLAPESSSGASKRPWISGGRESL